MPRRRIYHVQWRPTLGLWDITVNGRKMLSRMPGNSAIRKRTAVWWACDLARKDWKRGQLAQVVIHKKNGRIQVRGEHTYGRDPERRKG